MLLLQQQMPRTSGIAIDVTKDQPSDCILKDFIEAGGATEDWRQDIPPRSIAGQHGCPLNVYLERNNFRTRDVEK